MTPDNPNNDNETMLLISLGNTPPRPRTRKLTPRVIPSQRAICSIFLDECFMLGVIITSLIGLSSNNRNNCLLKIPINMMIVPRINQKRFIMLFPYLLGFVGLTVTVTRWWSGRDDADLTENVPAYNNSVLSVQIPPVGCTLCYTPSNTLHYKTHVSIYMLLAGLPAA